MQVTKTYSSKSNTISRNEKHMNVGLNPIIELNYGKNLTRGMIYFDHEKVKKMVEDKVYPDITKLKHTLKMTNCASLVMKRDLTQCVNPTLKYDKKRAVSFDLILFLISNEWDEGVGFDFVEDVYRGDHRAFSTDGSNWIKSKNYYQWESEGIYSTDKLSRELDLFTSGKDCSKRIIFSYKHFDVGNEDLEIDVTEIFNKFITGDLKNYGFGIAFSPSYENIKCNENSYYVGFFTRHTHSYFEPYIETTYDEFIEDDRANFYLDKKNKLYFYASVGGNYVNLDKYPTCTINGLEYDVKQATKGVYYVDIRLSSSEYSKDTMFYDEWSNIVYKGTEFPDVTLDFVTKSNDYYFSFGLPSSDKQQNVSFIPNVYGINNKEKILRGDIRKINVECHIPYTSKQLRSVEGIEYRIYVRSHDKEMDCISWTKVERGYNENYFLLNTSELIPHRYHIDLRVKQNMELTYYNNNLEFDIVSEFDKTNK